MQQVRSLEDRLGVRLVARAGRGMALTEAGKTLARELEEGFATIQAGVNALTIAQAHQPVQVTMSPAFAVKWLMPKIADFQTRHPDVTLLLNPTGRNMELKPGGIDLAIRYSRSDGAVDPSTALVVGDLAVVGAPSCIEARKIKSPADLINYPWLQELGTSEVSDWFARHGVKLDRPLMISHMPGNLIMESVKRGDGITYTFRQWLHEEIRSGELLEFFPEERGGFFYIHTPPGTLRRPVKLFIEWLKEQSSE